MNTFRPLFDPVNIAVIGGSVTGVAPGNRFIRHLKAYGYRGAIWPIHPSATEIEGLPAYTSVAATPDVVDYAYVAIAAQHVPPLLRTFDRRVRIAQVISSGFAETAGGEALEKELLVSARESGVRVIGPNCLGVHSPRARVTFSERTTPEVGSVGIVCQSGGLGVDIARRGQNRGLRFSGLVTVGNCVDVRPSELIEYFLESPDTAVIRCTGYDRQFTDGGDAMFRDSPLLQQPFSEEELLATVRATLDARGHRGRKLQPA